MIYTTVSNKIKNIEKELQYIYSMQNLCGEFFYA